MDDASASHTQVMNSIQAFLATLPAHTRLAMQRVFAEAEAADSLGKYHILVTIMIIFAYVGKDPRWICVPTIQSEKKQ